MTNELKIVSAKELPKFQNDNFILVGPAGGGKSTLVGTMPGRTLVLAFDVSARGAYQKFSSGGIDLIEVLPEQQDLTPYTTKDMKAVADGKMVVPSQGQKRETGRVFLDIGAFLNKLVADGIIPGVYKNIVTDTITSLQGHTLDAVMAKDGRAAHNPNMNDYTAAGRLIESWFDQITRLPMNCFFLVHDEPDKDEITKRIMYRPLLTGKSGQRCITKVNHLMRCTALSNKDGVAYTLQTAPDVYSEAIRTSFAGLPPKMDVTIKDFSKPQEYGLGAIIKSQSK
jgi:hypothetical protein